MLALMGRNQPARWKLLATAAVMLLLGPLAHAENGHLTRARAAYDQLDYDKVTPLLEQALAQNNTVEDEVAIYELLGLIHVTYGHDQDAQAAFVELLKRRPDYRLPADSSPKIVSVFELAKSELVRRQASETPKRTSGDPRPPAHPVPPKIEPTPIADRTAATGDRPVAGERSTPFYGQWWFWTGAIATVGLSSVAAGVLVWFITRPGVPETDFGPYPIK